MKPVRSWGRFPRRAWPTVGMAGGPPADRAQRHPGAGAWIVWAPPASPAQKSHRAGWARWGLGVEHSPGGQWTVGGGWGGNPGGDIRAKGEAGMGSRELCLDDLERKGQVSKTASRHVTLAWCHLPSIQGYLHVGISRQSSG